ncbi:MAG: VWA domain-containing protein [Paludibacter sp.]|jgi:Ca-activated chloride channel family protein|nr:VWA domain-containing protein [Paludibacter sp.]
MTFHNPEYLFGLLVLIPMVYWFLKELHRSDASLQISSHRSLRSFPRSIKVKLLNVPYYLRFLSVALLIIAIARPQSSNSWRTENTEGIDIMIALDISGSMLAEDFRPNRLEASKSVANEFILSRPNDNIGLVLFAAKSFTQCPLTTDHAVLINLFNSINYGMIEDGTAIGLGLANAVARLKESKAKSKVVILLTDGDNNRGDIAPVSAGELAQAMGIRVYTIGVGSHGMVNIPIQTPLGMQYQQIESAFDERPLKEIAEMTGGQYFRATNNEKLRSIYAEIDQMEKTKINVREYSKKYEEYFLFALAALVMLIAEVLIRNVYLRKIP